MDVSETANVPATQTNVPLTDWQQRVFEQLRTGVKFHRFDVENRFDIASKIARRDRADLLVRNLIVFVRTPTPGHYTLARR